uniref:G_PROTEIN_RECEP_F1_2 domain-containing protein n=1 Tax=Strongyloides papillosus TaxID=174720 RepID=A0A0N5CG08_STREA
MTSLNEICIVSRNESFNNTIIQRLINSGCSCKNISYINEEFFDLNCFPFPLAHTILTQIIYITMFVFLITAAIVGNVTVVWIILFHKKMRTVTNYYLLNLAIADISISILNTGFSGMYNLYYNWKFGSFYCAVNSLMGVTPICVSVFTMIVLSIDRYLAIVYPLRKRPGKSQTLAIIFLIWFLAILWGLPSFFASKVNKHFFWDDEEKFLFEDETCSATNFPDGNQNTSFFYKLYNNALFIIQYVLPLLILSFTYGKTVIVLRKSESIGDSIQIDNIMAKRKVANMLALIVVMFTFMWMPYNLYFLLKSYISLELDNKTENFIYLNIYWLGMASSVLNPLIYYFMHIRFRLGFKYAWRWLPFINVSKEKYELAFINKNTWIASNCPKSHIYINPHMQIYEKKKEVSMNNLGKKEPTMSSMQIFTGQSYRIFRIKYKLAHASKKSDFFEDCWVNLPSTHKNLILNIFEKDFIKETLANYWTSTNYSKGLTYLKQLGRFFEDPKTYPKLYHSLQKLTDSNQFTQYLTTNRLQLTKGSGINWYYTVEAIKDFDNSLIFDNTLNGELLNPFGTSFNPPTTSFNVVDHILTTVLDDSIITTPPPQSTSSTFSDKNKFENNFKMSHKFSFKDCRFIFEMDKFCHKSATYSLEEFIKEFKENADLDQIPENYLIRAFRARIKLETCQYFPDSLPDEKFDDYAKKCIDIFPSCASQDLISAQYLSATIDHTKFEESLRGIYKLSVKAYKGLPTFQAQHAFKMRLKELLIRDNDLWAFTRDYKGLNHMLVEDLILRQSENVARSKLTYRSRNYDRPFNSFTNSSYVKPKCDHCQFTGHVDSECKRKLDGLPKGYYTQRSNRVQRPFTIKTENVSSDNIQSNVVEKIIRKISTLKINNTDVDVLFDTGSDVSLIIKVLGIGGISIQTSVALIYLTINKIKHQIHAYVSSNPVLSDKILVGNDFLDRFPDFTITSTYVRLGGDLFYFHKTKESELPETHIALSSNLTNEQRHEIFNKHIKEMFPKLHSAHPYDIGDCSISIPKKHFLPENFILQKRYRLNPIQWEALKNHVSTLVNSKILIKQETKFISNYVIVQSPGKEDRFAIDLRAINSATVRDSYPTRTVQEIFQEIKGSTYMTSIDATKAFLSLRLDPSDYQYYGVFTPYGTYCYTRMPFGDVNAMAAWQRVYDTIAYESQAPALSYADDMLIINKSNDIHEHLSDVIKFCETASKYGLKFNVDKLTHVMPNRKLPSTVKELKGFLASAAFFHEAVKNFTARATSLLDCVRILKKGKIELDDTQQSSFYDIVNALISSEILTLPDFTKEFHVYTDASSTHMGAVIVQIHNNILKPIPYFSKKFPYVKQAKSSNLLKLQAMALTLIKNTDILSTASIHLYCDNATAIALLKESVDPRFNRYISYIEMFNVKIHKIQGTKNVVADELSRKTEIIEDILTNSPEVFIAEASYLPDSKLIIQDQKNAGITSDTPDTTVVKDVIIKIILKNKKKNLVPYLSHLSAENLSQLIHIEYAHPGIKKTLELVKTQFYADNLKDIVTKLVKGCEICLKTKPFKHIHLEYKAISISEKPFTEISIDHFQVVAKPDKLSFLNIVDTTSRLWVPEIVSKESSEEVLKTLKAAFYTYGFPTFIKANNQSCFRSTAKHHQGNSLVERSFSTLRKMLRAAYLENNQNLSETDFIRENIKKIAFIYNNMNHDTTGISPFEHVFGRSGKPKMLEKILNPDYSPSFDINDLVKSWPELSKKAHEKRQNINVKLPNAGIKPLNDIEVGDIIARRQTPDSKLAALYGPNLTVKKIGYPYIYAS